jgi:UDP-4-amino-4,6-dideoxy-N-acetyl-beta-L-altrosamine transaminase
MLNVRDSRVALEGGAPVRGSRLPYGRHSIDEQDIAAVVEALRSDFLTTGPRIEEFEQSFAAAVGARFAVAFCNGTAALHGAAFAAKLDASGSIVTTPLTFVATANCARYMGAAVSFADVRAGSLTLDPAAVRQAMTPRTKAIITCDYAGQPSDLDELLAVSAEHGAIVIEDACHALGATYRGRGVGSIAPLSVFSLHPVKHITTGEGGVVTTADPALADRLRLFRTHGIRDERASDPATWLYDMVELGYNYRITDFQCALGTSQLARMGTWLARRRAIAAMYEHAFKTVPQVETPQVLPDREHAWHLYVIRLRLESLRVDRERVFRALRAENIGVNVHYIPVPWHSYYEALGFRRGAWPVAEGSYERMITLPMFPAMSDEDVDDVIAAVRKVVSYYAA